MNIYEILNSLNIKYEKISHKAIYTCEEAQFLKDSIEGIPCKNLFLTDHKKHYYLVTLEDTKKLDLKSLAKSLGASRLSFASKEELESVLGLQPGSVTPLGIINDKNKEVTIILSKNLQNNKVLVHPKFNTETLSIDFNDLIKFIEYENHNYLII